MQANPSFKTRPFISAGGFYFLFYGSMACLLPYLAVYYRWLGLDGRQIGLLSGIPALVNIFCTPFWAGYADAARRHRLVYLILAAGSLVMVAALSQARDFRALIVIVLLHAFFYAAVMPLVDNAVMAMLGEQRAQYGKLRLWGAVSWGIAAPLMGRLTETNGMQWIFIGFSVLFVAATAMGLMLPLDMGHAGQPFWHGIKQLLTNRRLVLFLSLAFVGGMVQSTVNNFLFLFLSDLKASQTMMGLALTISTLSEVPMLFFADRFQRRLGSQGMLVMSMLIYMLRLILYALSPSAWPVLLIQLMHGFTFPMLWVAGVSFASEVAPPGLGATAQGLLSSVVWGFSAGLGAFLAGQIYQSWGGHIMYLSFAVLGLISLAIYMIAEKRMRSKQ